MVFFNLRAVTFSGDVKFFLHIRGIRKIRNFSSVMCNYTAETIHYILVVVVVGGLHFCYAYNAFHKSVARKKSKE